MSWLGFWRKKRWTSEEIRDALMEAVKQNNIQELRQLCKSHQPIIREVFAQWQTMPDAIRREAALAEFYPIMLTKVADWFAEHGETALKALLLFHDDEDPCITWERLLQQVQTELENVRTENALQLLKPLEERLSQEEGSHIDHYRPRVWSMLSTVHFRQGQQNLAEHYMKQAIQHCERIGDELGIRRYTDSLNIMQNDARWRS